MAKEPTFKERVLAGINGEIDRINGEIENLDIQRKGLDQGMESLLYGRGLLEKQASVVEEMPQRQAQANGSAERNGNGSAE